MVHLNNIYYKTKHYMESRHHKKNGAIPKSLMSRIQTKFIQMKNLLIILSFAFLPVMTSCQKSASIVGTWQIDKENTSQSAGYSSTSNATFTFKEDGSCSLEEAAQIIFKSEYKLSSDGSEVTFLNVKNSSRSSDGVITFTDSKDVYVVSVIILTDATLKLGSFRHEGESVEASKGKNKDYSSWKKI
jgi:hypothetical protein